jgi:hypothetical protein
MNRRLDDLSQVKLPLPKAVVDTRNPRERKSIVLQTVFAGDQCYRLAGIVVRDVTPELERYPSTAQQCPRK